MQVKRVLSLGAAFVAVLFLLPSGIGAQGGGRGIAVSSLKEMVGRSDFIVQASAASIFPTYQFNSLPNGSSTKGRDTLLRTSRVLKGSPAVLEFVVSQLVGTSEGDEPMKVGQQYILFLNPAQPNALQALPQRSSPRYAILGGHLGIVAIDETGNVKLSSDLPFHSAFDRKSTDLILSEIATLVRQPDRPK